LSAKKKVELIVLKRILITGGAGFIGSHLTGRLLAEGHTVYCLDNLSSGHLRNVASFQDQTNFVFLEQDVCDPFSDEIEVNEIYNLACPASPVHYRMDPIKTLRTCVLGALNVLDLATKQSATVLQASTSEVYGDPQQHPQGESYRGYVNPIGPRACYNEGKRCAETLFFDYHRQHGTSIKVARIFNTYGPNMHPDDGRVVSNFIVRALTGEPLEIFGSGAQTRSFCYIDDTIEGLVRLMASAPTSRGPINLGSDVETDVETLGRLILDITKSESKVIRDSAREDDPLKRRPDLQRAKTELGWSPQTSLRDGLDRTITAMRSIISKTI
jgi:UDP-glucuronate decarboxylase